MSAICVEMVGIPPSPNELRRMHWAERGKEMKSWREGSYKTALDLVNRLHWKTLDRAWVEIVITCREHNRRDPDNAIAAMKPLIDGLVDAGAIKDDSFDVIASLTIRQTFGKHDGVALWIKDEPPRL